MWRAEVEGAAAAAEACARWRLLPEGAPIVTFHGFLQPVRRCGAALMVKVVNPDDEEVKGVALLVRWGGRSAVRLIAVDGAAMVMERVTGDGPNLAEMAAAGQDAEATDILCDIALQLLERAPLPTPGWRDMADRRDDIVRDLDREAMGPGDLALFDRALEVAARRLEARAGWRLLHGDLHHFNALKGARGWLAIDPKGLVGPPAAEFAPMLCNPLPAAMAADPGRMSARLWQIAGRTGIGADEIADWMLIHVAACAAWSRGPDRTWWLSVLRAAGKVAGAG